MSDFNFLSKLGSTERDFIALEAERAIATIGSKNLEDKLATVSRVFVDKSVGCGEAILAGKLARAPSQIKKQRYCAEEALKNLLLLSHLGITAIPIETLNFNGTGQAHDTILVPSQRKLFMLDWGEVRIVRLNGKNLVDAETGERIAQDFYPISQEALISEIGRFTESNLIEAFSFRHLIARRDHPTGNIESSVFFDEKQRRLTFNQLVTDLTMHIPFFYETTIIAGHKAPFMLKTVGLAPSRTGIKCSRIPILYDSYGKIVRQRFSDSLSESEKEAFALGMAYRAFLKDSRKVEKSSLDTEDFHSFLKSTADLSNENETARAEAQTYLDFYSRVRQAHDDKKAGIFLDSLRFKLAFKSEHKDATRAALDYTGCRTLEELGEDFVEKNISILRQHYFSSRDNPERVLLSKFLERFGYGPRSIELN